MQYCKARMQNTTSNGPASAYRNPQPLQKLSSPCLHSSVTRTVQYFAAVQCRLYSTHTPLLALDERKIVQRDLANALGCKLLGHCVKVFIQFTKEHIVCETSRTGVAQGGQTWNKDARFAALQRSRQAGDVTCCPGGTKMCP
jgi:hypothetical protein